MKGAEPAIPHRIAFGIGSLTISAGQAAAAVAISLKAGWFVHHMSKADDVIEATQIQEQETSKKKEKRDNLKFPENPDDLLPELPRDEKGRIQTADNLRIRPEKHELEPRQTYNSRHHEQHYHVESRRDPIRGWRHDNKEIYKPKYRNWLFTRRIFSRSTLVKKKFVSTIDFADSEFKTLELLKDGNLIVNINSWQERNIELTFTNAIQFCHKPSSTIANLYEILTVTPFLKEALERYYEKVPDDHPFKLFQIIDIDGVPFLEVIARSVQVRRDE